MRLIALITCLILGCVANLAAAEDALAPEAMGETTEPMAPATEQMAANLTAEDLRKCSRKNFPEKTAEQSFSMKMTDASGSVTEQKGKLRWRVTEADLTEINICFTSPASVSGACYLVLEREGTDDMFVYLPSLNRVKRVLGGATSQKLLNTDISYADLKHMQGLAAGGELQRLEDAMLNDRPVYRLEGKPEPTEESPYNRVVSHLGQESCAPLQVDLYGLGNKLRKRIHVRRESMQEVDGRWMIHDIALRDLLNETRTEIVFEDIVYDEEIASRVFNRRLFYTAP